MKEAVQTSPFIWHICQTCLVTSLTEFCVVFCLHFKHSKFYNLTFCFAIWSHYENPSLLSPTFLHFSYGFDFFLFWQRLDLFVYSKLKQANWLHCKHVSCTHLNSVCLGPDLWVLLPNQIQLADYMEDGYRVSQVDFSVWCQAKVLSDGQTQCKKSNKEPIT